MMWIACLVADVDNEVDGGGDVDAEFGLCDVSDRDSYARDVFSHVRRCSVMMAGVWGLQSNANNRRAAPKSRNISRWSMTSSWFISGSYRQSVCQFCKFLELFL